MIHNLPRIASLLDAVGAALAASACCIGPLAFALLGIGGAGSLLALEPYRPVLTVLTLAVATSIDVVINHDERHVSPSKLRRTLHDPSAAAPTATPDETLPPRKARSPPSVVSSCNQQQSQQRQRG